MQDILLFIHQHLFLCLALVIVLFTLVLVEFYNQRRAPQQISLIKATQLINHGNAKIVDIRSSSLYSDGHIIGAVSLPLSELKEKISKIDKFKTQPIVITCASGVESSRASAILKDSGFDVRILSGGIRAWTDASLPLVKE
jgi:rhodanese-related sulfurtransferase